MIAGPLVEIKDLKKYFKVSARSGNPFKKDLVRAVDGVDLQIQKGETLGLVGESGCGKTTLSRTIIRLVEKTAGRIFFDAEEISMLSRKKMRMVRKNMQIIFQDPFSSLDPRMKVGDIVAQPAKTFKTQKRDDRKEMVSELLDAVGLEPESSGRFPHEFSGGQRQRIAIARALMLRPKFIIADEPVSALDVSIRAQVLNLMKDLKRQFGLTYLYVSHDLSTVKFISDRVAVMYLGRIVEQGTVGDIFKDPLHPYTRILIEAVPIPDPLKRKERTGLTGEPPSPIFPPAGCRFHPRCPAAKGICSEIEPEQTGIDSDRTVFCHLYKN